MKSFRIIGGGRAGLSMHDALAGAGWCSAGVLGRGDDMRAAASGVDVVIIATPDRSIATVAQAVAPADGACVVHLAGSRGLADLAPHRRRAAVHPLMTLPDRERGAARLRGAWFAIAGDPVAAEIVSALAGRSFTVADDARPLYHAAAVVASNHLVALLGQVERLAAEAHVPFAAFFDLVRASVDNAEALGPAAALTGPAARGDHATIDAHLAAMNESERDLYRSLIAAALRLVEGR